MESTSITTLIRCIPKFDGTPSKFQDWKHATRAMLQLARPGIFEILDGKKRPQEIYTQVPHPNTINTPVHSVADADGDDSDNVENQQGLADELQEAGASPALDVAAKMCRLGTERSMSELTVPSWRPHNVPLLNNSIRTLIAEEQQKKFDLH